MSRQRYSPEFKDEAVRQLVDHGHSVAEVADRLGVSTHSLHKWVNAVKPDKSDEQAAQLIEAKSEILKLPAQLRRAEEECDILNRPRQIQLVIATLYIWITQRRGGLMAQMGRAGLSVAQKAAVWERWRSGDSLSDIGRAINKHPASLFGILRLNGGITPAARKRSDRCLRLDEREEISRGIAAGRSLRHAVPVTVNSIGEFPA